MSSEQIEGIGGVRRPLAEILTELPVREGASEHAGPGFELYSELQVPSHLPSRWTILIERLGAAAAECRRLAPLGPAPLVRLDFLGRNLELLGANVGRLAAAA